MSWINLGEVFSVVHRATGVDRARAVVSDLRHRLHLDLPTEARVLEAASIKAGHALAYADADADADADAFAIATAVAHRASLLTGDPEVIDDGDPTWPVVDLRS